MIVTCPANDSEFRQALRLILWQPGLGAADLDERVDVLRQYCTNHDLSLDNVLVAREDSAFVSACLCIDSPGRTSAVFVPVLDRQDRRTEVLVELLRQVVTAGCERGIVYLQAMVEPESREVHVFREAGFTFLARMLYLESDLTQFFLPIASAPSLNWETYNNQTHDLFSKVLVGTYEDSRDCPLLNGVRNVEDILAAHRSTGQFDARLWQVACGPSGPVGILLLAFIPERWSYEVVYMGLLPSCRGQGYAAALLGQAVREARERAVMKLTLSVDETNVPARRWYERFGFRERNRRDAWIRVLQAADSDSER
ncbi:MAG: GNAT family N-acetyltransferase [Phycisphaerales bacterium]|nr:GNAT family N-acetyltransferase [Phycisphaerales bacterium]